MKNILVIADGKTAQRFLARLVISDTSHNRYTIVYYTDSITPHIKDSDKFKYCKFDPTSFVKLETLLKDEEYYQCMLIVKMKEDFLTTYKNIRKIDEKLQISAVDRWDSEFNDSNLTILDLQDTVSNIFSNFLPDFPLFAKNLGLGTGEIMELKIPTGSSYSYRHVRTLNQNRWKLAAIYREHKLILPTLSTVLLPNDSILIVGNPNILKGIYRSVKRELGQFPIPYGENIYCYIDMLKMDDEIIELIINDAMILHSKLNNKKLIVKIVNSRLTPITKKIKSYANSFIVIEFEYYKRDSFSIIRDDIGRYNIGLIVTNDSYFKYNLSTFYRLRVPVLKVGKGGFFSLKSSVILSSSSKRTQKTSATIFDISTQLGISVSVLDSKLIKSDEQKKIISEFRSSAKIFDQKIDIIESDSNPVLKLREKSDLLQFVIFEKKLMKSKFLAYFSTTLERHYFRFSDNYQLFIPADS